MGNRIAKYVYNGSELESSTFYVRDAQGTTIAVYDEKLTTEELDGVNITTLKYALAERHIYGSSRLGMDTTEVVIPNSMSMTVVPTPETNGSRYLGKRLYELSNHLGNVLTVISDRKMAVPLAGTSEVWYYRPHLVSVTDYSPFDVALTARTWSDQEYRYGFNGKEENDEFVYGDYGFRYYHSALARFIQVDPLRKNFPFWTTYQFAGNMPIIATDLDGAEPDLKIEFYPEPQRRIDWDWTMGVVASAFYYKIHDQGNLWHIVKYQCLDGRTLWYYWSNPCNTLSHEGKWISDSWLPNGAPDQRASWNGLMPMTVEVPRENDWEGFYKTMHGIGELYDDGAKALIASTFVFCGAAWVAEVGVTEIIFGESAAGWVKAKAIKATISLVSQAATGSVDVVDVVSDALFNSAFIGNLVNAGFTVEYDMEKGKWKMYGPLSEDFLMQKFATDFGNGMLWDGIAAQFAGVFKDALREGTEEFVVIELTIELPSACSSEGSEKVIDSKTEKK